jgi:pSer/pThr/pTyr-binding forkhead associated (FHA) protein
MSGGNNTPATPLTNTLVTMYVDTSVALTPTNIKDHVWFADTDGDIVNDNGGNVSNYLTDVVKNGNVTWVGAVQDIRTYPSDYVLITNIIMSNGNESKINIDLMPSTPGNGNKTHVNGGAIGQISPLPLEYTISFRVGRVDSNGQRTWNDFSIDPKLRINQ